MKIFTVKTFYIDKFGYAHTTPLACREANQD